MADRPKTFEEVEAAQDPADRERWERAERDAKIHARRIEGFTLRAIASEFKLSVERVREIAKRMEHRAKWRERAIRLGGAN
jgi:Mor family transcriptional regulator